MTPTAAARPLALTALLLAWGAAVVVRAEPPTESPRPRLLALELAVLDHAKGDDAVTESVTPRIVRHLKPQLEQMGYIVEHVRSAKDATRTGTHDLGILLAVDARAIYLVHDARRYDEAWRVEHDTGLEAWGEWTLWSSDQLKEVTKGKLGPVRSGIHQAGAGRPVIDDQESVARLFADAAMQIVGPWEQYLRDTPPGLRVPAKD
jgi:hypothetical protein